MTHAIMRVQYVRILQMIAESCCSLSRVLGTLDPDCIKGKGKSVHSESFQVSSVIGNPAMIVLYQILLKGKSTEITLECQLHIQIISEDANVETKGITLTSFVQSQD
jgi:hypothetical protein